ncbi:uncharacterized protein LOC131038134 isoform X2 [Cryptomeria japonica]|uniref:uncharacterized protein LOC131038134 isoform X2 n=1 Tax=Cryptomeria japonica TaxID=3369 RepID=UPI0027DA5997|nr:uncharacterized protein LOC131038134 isoform X2 [Cryptomeria japonica]
MSDDAGHDVESFWKNPVSKERIFFIDSVDSEEFRLFCWAMERAFIVGMDSEWKASFLSKSSRTPRVSIFQIACRIYDYDEHISEADGQSKEVRVSVEERFDGFTEGFDVSRDVQNFVPTIEEAKWRRKLFGEFGNGDDRRVQELIFLLDLLVLPLSSFGKTLRSVLISVDTLKLGFKFKQDLMYLAGTFSSEEAYSFFSMVDPYIDIGKIYNYLQNHDLWSLNKGRNKMLIQQSKGLSSICEEVLGFKLSKDLQCSDWEKRPLMDEQIAYAAADAYCLIRIFDVVHQKLLDLDQGGTAQDEITDSSVSTTIIGLRELLSFPCHNGNKHILRAKFGLAADIVKETMKGSLSMASLSYLNYKRIKIIPFYKPISKIAQIIGERILLSECESKARFSTRKRRSRRFRTSESTNAETIERYSEWKGPPPWDPALGGDGIPRFLCDVMVEGLAKQLRCVGIDAATPSFKKADPRQLLEQAHTEKRVLLTRDTKLLRRNLIPNNQAYRVKNLAKQEQLLEVIEIFNLQITEYQLMSRCIKCNGKFIEKSLTRNEAIEAATSEQVIPECLIDLDLEFWQCADCQQIYWEGTQYHNAIQQFSNICKVND